MAEHSRRDRMALEHAENVRGSGTWRRTHCGFCELRGFGYDRRGNWCLNVDKGYYHCFRCDVRGYLPGYEPDEDAPKPEPLPEGALGPPEGYLPLTEPVRELDRARRYVLKRGISKETAIAAKLGACVDGPFEGRIVVPVLDEFNAFWVGWSARLYGGANVYAPKYRYPQGMKKSEIVYNQAAIKRDTDEPLICVEGVFDALPYFPDAVAFLGKPGPKQVELLLDSERPVCICLDGDAWLEGEMLGRKLQFLGRDRVRWLRLPPRTDPGSVDPGRLRDEVRRAFTR